MNREKRINWCEISNTLSHIVTPKFTCHISDSDWGGSVLIMEKSGKAFARTYWFNDDTTTIYFDWLSVDESERGNGIATQLLNAHIEVAKKFELKTTLWVKKDTWVHEWYIRKGYKDYKDCENDGNTIWMHMTP